MMKQLLWIGLLASATSADTDVGLVESGQCAAHITSMSECEDAAISLALGDITAVNDNQVRVSYDPPYCYFEGGSLKFNVNGSNTGSCSSSDKCLCRGTAPSDNPTENPTEAPTENPTEVPTENPTENPTGVCCKEINAECLSGLTGVTEEEFCDAFPGTLGCTVCCKAFTAECLSCQLGLTVEEFCIANPSTPGCTDPCREYRHKGSCRKQRNCIWKKVDKKCMTG